MEVGEDGVISLKLARVEMAELLSSDGEFVVMGESVCGNRLVVYSRRLIRGLPVEYKGYGVDQVCIYSVRFTVEQQEAHERRKARQG